MLELFEQLEALSVGPDDVVILRAKRRLSPEQAEYLRAGMARFKDVPLLILDAGVSLSKMTRAELLAQLEGEEKKPEAASGTAKATDGTSRSRKRRTAGVRRTTKRAKPKK